MLQAEALRPWRGEETVDIADRTLPLSSVLDYDVARWNVRALVSDYFGTDDLENLHLDPRWNPHDPAAKQPSTAIMRNSWAAGKALREAVMERSMPVLKSLIYDRISDFVGTIRSHQTAAMMRVNFHGSRSILRFHSDQEYGQTPDTVNVWLPVTSVHGSNSMYVESAPGLSDFAPLELEYGQIFLFYGTEMLHGTLDNMSGGTRISYDFRFSI
ncbi:MAG TPA: StrG-like protein [Allosphingosinicella sp.]|jgi:ectoine hydroxylase-related dioxygenase (phytanoyl-CoA dioxygenase family)